MTDLILPDAAQKGIADGFAPGTQPGVYGGGIGDSRTEALRKFVKGGGMLSRKLPLTTPVSFELLTKICGVKNSTRPQRLPTCRNRPSPVRESIRKLISSQPFADPEYRTG